MRRRIIAGLLLAAVCLPAPAAARVERIEILSREAFAAGAEFGSAGTYEKLRGRAFFALDPDAAANAPVADLKRAPRNARGLVEFSAEFLVLRPTDFARRNGTLLYEVNNRGNIGILRQLDEASSSNDPATVADAGNGFLFRQGFTLVWSAWAADVAAAPGDGRLVLRCSDRHRSAARRSRATVAYELIVNAPRAVARFTGLLGTAYPLASEGAPDAVLTERDRPDGERRPIPAFRLVVRCVERRRGRDRDHARRAASSPGASISSPTLRAIRPSSPSEWRASAISCRICAIIRWRERLRRRSV